MAQNGLCVGCGKTTRKGSDLCGDCTRMEPEVRLLISQGKTLPFAPNWKRKLAGVNPETFNSHSTNPQCGGKTKKGERCKLDAIPGSRFCGFHQEEQKETPVTKQEEESQEKPEKKEVPELDEIEKLPNPRQFIYTLADVLEKVGLSKKYDLTTLSLEELRQKRTIIQEEVLPEIEERVKKLREIRLILDEKIRVEIGREKKKLIDLKIPFGDTIGILLGSKESAGTKELAQKLLRQVDETIKPLEEAEKIELERQGEEARLNRPITVRDLELLRDDLFEEIQSVKLRISDTIEADIADSVAQRVIDKVTPEIYRLLQDPEFKEQIAQGIAHNLAQGFLQEIGPDLEAIKKALLVASETVKVTQR